MSFTQKEKPNCDQCQAVANCIYSLFDRRAQNAWKTMLSASSFSNGHFLFNEGDFPSGLFIVCKGRVKICKTSASGQQLISRIEKTGDLAGHISLFAGGNFESSAEIMGEALISKIERTEFIKFLEKHPQASLALMQALAKDVRAGDTKAHNIAYKSAKSRMADILLDTSVKQNNAYVISGIKRRELAEMAGLTVETAVRILAEFEKKKLIKRNGKEIEVTGKQTLEEMASSDI